jgi:hypothetical protein
MVLLCLAANLICLRNSPMCLAAHVRLQIRVFCRVRPHPDSVVRCLAGGSALSLNLDGKEHSFAFDKVFGPGISQQQVSTPMDSFTAGRTRTSVVAAEAISAVQHFTTALCVALLLQCCCA